MDFSPTSKELASSVVRLLELNFWYSIILLIDGSISSLTFQREILAVIKGNIRIRVNVVKILNVAKIRSSLVDLELIGSHIVILHCDSNISKHILFEARQYNLLSSQWIWIVVDRDAINMLERQYSNVSSFQGLLAVRPRYQTKTRKVFRSLFKVFVSVLQRIDIDVLQDIPNSSSSSECSFQTSSKPKRMPLISFHR